MAWTFTGARGQANSASAGTTVTRVPTSNFTVGSIAVVMACADNIGTTDVVGASNELRCSDNSGSGQKWIKLGEVRNGRTAANAGITIAAWYCKVISLTTSHTVTVTLSASRTAKGMTLEEFAIGSGKEVYVAGGNGGLHNASAAPTVTCNPGSAPSSSRLWLGMVGREGDGDETLTQDASFTGLGGSPAAGKFGTTTLSTTSNSSAVCGYKISTSDTTETYNPTIGTARDLASALWALDERDGSNFAALALSFSPFAYWRCTELTGDFCIDYAGQNPGKYTAAPTLGSAGLVVGDPATGVNLNGSSQWVDVPTHTDFDVADGPVAAFMRIKRDTNDLAFARVMSRSQTSFDFGLHDTTPGKMVFTRLDAANSIMESGSTVITDTTLAHSVAFDKNAATSHINIDGADVGVANVDVALTDTALSLTLGSKQTGTLRYFDGTLQEVLFFKAIPTADQYAALHNAAAGTRQRPYRNPMPALIAQ